jgi:hypothetical protein
LRLGVIRTIAPYLLPQLVVRCTRSRPGCRSTSGEHDRESRSAPSIGELDAAILALPRSARYRGRAHLRRGVPRRRPEAIRSPGGAIPVEELDAGELLLLPVGRACAIRCSAPARNSRSPRRREGSEIRSRLCAAWWRRGSASRCCRKRR